MHRRKPLAARQLIGGLQNFEEGFDALDVFGERAPPSFIFTTE